MNGENPIRVRLLEILANSEELNRKELYIENIPRATVQYHLAQLAHSGSIRMEKDKISITPRGMALYLKLLDEGLTIPPEKLSWRIGVWLNRPLVHAIFATVLILIYALLKGRAVAVFHITDGSFLVSLFSFLLYVIATLTFILFNAKSIIFPANYSGLMLVALFAFLPLKGLYRLGYALIQTASLILCTEALYRSTRIGRYKGLAFNLAIYLAGLILC